MIEPSSIEQRLLVALREVQDPELPISIVDMGLVVGLRFVAGIVHLQITFTAMGCPAMDMIVDDVRARLMREPEVQRVDIDVVWEPIWSKSRLSEDGKAQLREWGISV
jgi:metal-sulfur cluster biosynthetic enzyme